MRTDWRLAENGLEVKKFPLNTQKQKHKHSKIPNRLAYFFYDVSYFFVSIVRVYILLLLFCQ